MPSTVRISKSALQSTFQITVIPTKEPKARLCRQTNPFVTYAAGFAHLMLMVIAAYVTVFHLNLVSLAPVWTWITVTSLCCRVLVPVYS